MINIREQYAEEIQNCKDYLQEAEEESWSDIEKGHSMADDALCELLRDMGLYDIVEQYDKIEKWYA